MKMTTLMTTKIMLFYVLGVLGQSALGMEEELHNQHLNSMFNGLDEPIDKRAYTYVSEYKRLPVYNFGIGKRWIENNEEKKDRQYAFGLGKRSRPYSFGLGKRNDDLEYDEMGMNPGYLPFENIPIQRRENDLEGYYPILFPKRSRQPYGFGLGKRAWNSAQAEAASGPGKRPNELPSHKYYFGLGKREAEDIEDSV